MAQPDKNKQPEQPPSRRNRADVVAQDTRTLGATAFARAGFDDPSLVMRWSDIVGPSVADIARPVRLTQGATGGVLTIISEPAAALFLQHESRALRERINIYLGCKAVSKLRFVQGPVQKPHVSRANPQLPANVAQNDPARRFQGSERLQNALLTLARARHARRHGASD
jgi:hypothetical protein